MKIISLITKFLEYAEIGKNQSQKTIQNYHHYLKRFSRWAGNISPSKITLDQIHNYRLYLNRYEDEQGRTLSPKTQNYHLIALRAFLKYLSKNDIPSLAPEKIELGKAEKRSVEFLTREEMERMFKSAICNERSGIRDRAILEMLFSTGLRVSEIRNLNRAQVDLKRGEFMVRGKGRKPRIVFLSDDAAKWVGRYLQARPDNWKPLFINSRRQKNDDDLDLDEKYRLSTVSIQNIVRRVAKEAGIIKKVSPHTIRHSFATNLLFQGADLRSVQDLLGHESITTTQIYTHLTNKKLKEVHQKFHK
jgi:site-specific recombinase XerD